MRKVIRLLGPVELGLICLLVVCLSLISCGPGSAREGNVSPPREVEVKASRSGTAWANTPQVASAAFANAGAAWLLTYREGDLLHTLDAGATWDKIPASSYNASDKIKFAQVYFLDSEHGWAVNVEGEVWRTTDGGRAWAKISKLESDDPGWDGFTSASQLKFTDESHGWIVETFTVWRTEDGGLNWGQVFSKSDPRVKGQPVGGFFLNADRCWICGTGGEVYSTADGGKTWRVQKVRGATCSDVFFVNENKGWMSRSADGRLYSTDDGGETWQMQPKIDSKKYIESIWFLNDKEGWGAGRQLLGGNAGDTPADVERNLVTGIVLRTSDGGQSWRPVDVGADEPFFHRIYFTDSQRGWLLARDNVYHTDDGGNAWYPVLKLPPIKIINEPPQ